MSNPINIGLVGLGRAGWDMHCEELTGKEAMFRIVAACDIIPERLEKMAQRYGCATYARIEDLLADPQVELVDIATRSCDHFAHVKLALASGKHVQDEKPMCLTHTEALELQCIAAESKGHLFIRHNRRFEAAFNHIREIIASGILGDVHEIKLRRVGYSRRDDWQTLQEFGGGQLLNWGPHIIDHGLRLLESSLKSMWSDLKHIAAAGDAEDHLKIVLTGENGRVVDLEISGGAALSEPEYVVWGTKGALICPGDEITLRYLDPAVTIEPRSANPGTPLTGDFSTPDALPWVEKTIPVSPAVPVSMNDIWDCLYRTIREGAPFPITLDEAVSVMQVVSTAKAGTRF